MSENTSCKVWVMSQLSELGTICTGKTPNTKEPLFFGGEIPFIKPGDLDSTDYIYQTHDYLTEEGLAFVPMLPPNAIVVTCIGNLGKVGITTKISATNQQINSFIPNENIYYKFIYYQMMTLKPWLESHASATTISIINKGKFSQAPIIITSLAEQKIIADKLDDLLARVESIKTRLENIPEILKKFRQSVLSAAVSGKLTEEWRKKKGYKWELLTITDIGEVKGGKRLPKGDELTEENTGFPYIRAGQLKKGTVVKNDDARSKQLYITSETHSKISLYTVNAGDLYITIVGASIGDAGIIPEEFSGANLTENAAKITSFKKLIEPKFISYCLRSEELQRMIKSEIKSAAQGKLALKRIKELSIPYPHINEQLEIVSCVEKIIGFSDVVESEVNKSVERVKFLTQSILAKAFRGELTAQWREENPELISGLNSAEALLEKITAEKLAAGTVKKRAKKSSH